VNCVPHFDPGLLSISFLSSAEGLQLQDPATGAWFAGIFISLFSFFFVIIISVISS
jgi:hypothetical protein